MDWKQKLTSRKFWAAIANFVTMLVIAFGGTDQTATQITAIIMAGAGVIAWIVAEGMADAAGAKADVYMVQEQEPPDEE
jgi:hypothetical protein